MAPRAPRDDRQHLTQSYLRRRLRVRPSPGRSAAPATRAAGDRADVSTPLDRVARLFARSTSGIHHLGRLRAEPDAPERESRPPPRWPTGERVGAARESRGVWALRI